MDNNLFIDKEISNSNKERDVSIKVNEIIDIVNQKRNGIYSLSEFDTGKLYFPSPLLDSTSNQPILQRNVLSKVVNFGALPNGTKSVLHGINVDANLIFIDVSGCATNPGVSGMKLPYSSPVLLDNVELWADATHVHVKTGKNLAAYTICYITIEFIKI